MPEGAGGWAETWVDEMGRGRCGSGSATALCWDALALACGAQVSRYSSTGPEQELLKKERDLTECLV